MHDMPQHHFETGASCSRLIDNLLQRKNKDSAGGNALGSGPTEAQIKYMVILAQKAGTGLPAEALKSKEGASRWIQNNGGSSSTRGLRHSEASTAIRDSEQTISGPTRFSGASIGDNETPPF